MNYNSPYGNHESGPYDEVNGSSQAPETFQQPIPRDQLQPRPTVVAEPPKDQLVYHGQFLSPITKKTAEDALHIDIAFKHTETICHGLLPSTESLRGMNRIDISTGPSGLKVALIGGGFSRDRSKNKPINTHPLTIVTNQEYVNSIHELITRAAGGDYDNGQRSNGGRVTFRSFEADGLMARATVGPENNAEKGIVMIPGRKGLTAGKVMVARALGLVIDTEPTAAEVVQAALTLPDTIHFPADVLTLATSTERQLKRPSPIDLLARLERTIYKDDPFSPRPVSHLMVSDVVERILHFTVDPAEFLNKTVGTVRKIAQAETERQKSRAISRQSVPFGSDEHYERQYEENFDLVIKMLKQLVVTSVLYNEKQKSNQVD